MLGVRCREDSSIVTLSVASPGPVMTASVSTGTNTTQPGLSVEQPAALVKLCPLELKTKVSPKVRNHGERPYSGLKSPTSTFTFKTLLSIKTLCNTDIDSTISRREIGMQTKLP